MICNVFFSLTFLFLYFAINIPAFVSPRIIIAAAVQQLVPRASFVQTETRQLAVLRNGSAAVFRVIYSREMPRFLMYVLEREPHYSVHPVICPFVVCPGPTRAGDSTTFSERRRRCCRCCRVSLEASAFGAVTRVYVCFLVAERILFLSHSGILNFGYFD